jgi:hypothetical protein
MTLAGRSRTARFVASVSLGVALVSFAGCASRSPAEYVPPRLDLARYEALGIAEFSASRKSDLGTAATEEFVASVHSAQPGTPVLELGALGARGKLTPEAIRELAAREHLSAVFVGEVTESESKPRVAFDPSYGTASASAERKAKITVRLLDGASGATMWSATSERTIPVVALDGSLRGISSVRTTPADEARAILVRDLVNDVTYDLRPHWVQR